MPALLLSVSRSKVQKRGGVDANADADAGACTRSLRGAKATGAAAPARLSCVGVVSFAFVVTFAFVVVMRKKLINDGREFEWSDA